MSYFWYISKSKTDLLSTHYRRSLWDSFRELSMKLKTPIAEAELRFTHATPHLVSEIRRLEGRITKDLAPPGLENLTVGTTPLPPFFSFRSPAARFVDEQQFWVAGHHGGVALVLVGAAHHATGVSTSSSVLSPSIDPFRAITEKAEEASPPVHDDLPGACSYAWQAVMRVNGQNVANLPTVKGIAVTVAVVDAQRQQVRRAGIGGIRQVVVGTPLFVEQT